MDAFWRVIKAHSMEARLGCLVSSWMKLGGKVFDVIRSAVCFRFVFLIHNDGVWRALEGHCDGD